MNLSNPTDGQKLKYIQILAVLGFLAASFYAPKLWLTTKEFPIIPLFDNLYIPTNPIDSILAWAFMGSLLLLIFKPNRILGLTIVATYTYLCFVDQNRLQPYFYQSILTILAINIFPKNTKPRTILYTVALIFFATYFWSGVHKINEIFYEQWMHALTKHFSFIPNSLLEIFTHFVPFIEMLMGIFLLINYTRKFAVLSILLMHVIITALLFYLGYGFNVVPWNVQNIASVYILFWSLKTVSVFNFFLLNIDQKKCIILIFTVLLPFSNLFGYWDHLLSYSFFSSKLKYYTIEINDEKLKNQLPSHITKYIRNTEGKYLIYPNEWAGEVNRVLFYPEDRIIHYLDRYIKSFSETPDKEGLTTLNIYNQ